MPAANPFPTARKFLPSRRSLPQLRKAAAGCRGCDLYKRATQTVFGAGPPAASIMFIGEQPGDQEDLVGQPFIGPSGMLLDRVLEKVGIDRAAAYVTNAVKHFKWEPRGRKRIHSKPSSRQIAACRPWLEEEIKAIEPRIIVLLGATAAQSLMGPAFRVTQQRGKPITHSPWAPCIIATVHPSSLLRAPDEAARKAALAEFEKDMRVVKRLLARQFTS